MSQRWKPLPFLEGDQKQASEPGHHASLSASAGTGKTQVLTARVLRLLLQGVRAETILCITFTKAGAAEMAQRIHERLASWVRLDSAKLRKDLFALGERNDEEALARARTLFAQVLDAPGGGLRIQTIHAFAQSLLGSFPAEAGLTPGFRPLEAREEQQLARATLADLLVRAEADGDLGLVRDLQTLSLRLGEGGAEAFLMTCARSGRALDQFGSREAVEPVLRGLFGLPVGDVEEVLAAECCDDAFDLDALAQIGAWNAAWATKSGRERAGICERWAAADPQERVRLLEVLHTVWAKGDGTARSCSKGQAPPIEDYAERVAPLFECCDRLIRMRRVAAYLADLAAGLRAGQAFARAYARAKQREGAVDFDDLIARAEELLSRPGMGDWVRYKLDRHTDHILVDEAQDTNARQWSIVGALAAEFFAGKGAGGRHRTLFTVGDFKQAIFSFQGTDPREFGTARSHFERQARATRAEAERNDEPQLPPDYHDLAMDRSFRSSPQVLALVDRVLAELGPQALGLDHLANPHEAFHGGRAGSVTLWKAFSDEAADAADAEAGEEGWVPETVRRYAMRLARQVRRWLDDPFWLAGQKRALRPEDILILVRRRSDLAGLLVARLHAEGVPVAGVDRLLLSEPLGVQDLLAAARFAVQPLDDLNLASLLTSPLFGWDQERLFTACFERAGALWPHLRSIGADDPLHQQTLDGLAAILAMADVATPYGFLETLLSGPLEARRKLVERLGAEVRDPVEELLSSALQFESGPAQGLQGFLDWFARGEVEVVRDPSQPLDAVRVMTVHGAKGLQAPVVILADACVNPERARGQGLTIPLGKAGNLPVLRPRKGEAPERLERVLAEQEARAREEHWRLLYVALTRAEERLFIGGALGPADRGTPAEQSWYAKIEQAMAGLGCGWEDAEKWGAALRYGPPPERRTRAVPPQQRSLPLPDWLRRPAPAEERPPRPLAPSDLGTDDVAAPPPGPEQRQAALRGKLLHQLFERLPEVAPSERRARALHWLERAAGVTDAALREEVTDSACRIISDPAYAELFGPEALAEAPIAAVIGGGAVVSGTADRLLVGAERVVVADFKTGRRAPADAEDVPTAHLRQMAAYRAALQVIFPGRRVEAALLYTAAPVLIALPPDLLARHVPAGG